MAWNIAFSGVTTYVMAGISEPFDNPPCLNYKVFFSARKAITIHLLKNKNVWAVHGDISERNIWRSTPECEWFCKHFGKTIHPKVENIHVHRQKQLYYRISDRNTLIEQFIYFIQTKMAACQMVPIPLPWRRLSPLTLDRLTQTFTVCIEDPIDKVKWCAADNKSIGSNLLIKKDCLKTRG